MKDTSGLFLQEYLETSMKLPSSIGPVFSYCPQVLPKSDSILLAVVSNFEGDVFEKPLREW